MFVILRIPQNITCQNARCPNLDPVTASHPLSSHCESVQIVNRPGCRFQHGCWKPDFAHVGLCAQMGPAWTP